MVINFPAMTDSTTKQSPFLLRRLAAMLYDTFLVAALIIAVMFVVLPVYSLLTGSHGTDSVIQLEREIVWLVFLLVPMLFFCLFWLKNGQTLSMQAWRIKLQTFSGDSPNVRQCVIRYFGAILSAAALGLGYLWCLVDRNGRYWHDYLSGTDLFLLPKREKKPKS